MLLRRNRSIREIVGVARQVKARPEEIEDVLQIYVPLAQDPTDDIYLAVQSSTASAEGLTPSVRAAIARVDKEQLVSVRDVMTLEDIARTATSRQRFRATMVIAFASLALLLAMVGVFGILGYSVQLRVRDFGVRRALGASTAAVLRLAIGRAVYVIVAGTLIGLTLATMLARLARQHAVRRAAVGSVTFVAVTVVLTLTALLSMIGPAWRATRVDPAIALRADFRSSNLAEGPALVGPALGVASADTYLLTAPSTSRPPGRAWRRRGRPSPARRRDRARHVRQSGRRHLPHAGVRLLHDHAVVGADVDRPAVGHDDRVGRDVAVAVDLVSVDGCEAGGARRRVVDDLEHVTRRRGVFAL